MNKFSSVKEKKISNISVRVKKKVINFNIQFLNLFLMTLQNSKKGRW